MDIGRALTFFTEEERWIEKTTIGALVILLSSLLSFVLVGILGFFIVMGYGIRLMRNVQAGIKPVLPEWDQWGEDLMRGLKLFVVQFVWILPVFLVSVPIVMGAALADNSRDVGEFLGVMLILCGSGLVFLYGLFYTVLQPGITIAYARDEKISSGFKLTEIWQWTRAHISDVIVVTIVYIVASMIIGFVALIAGVVLCGVGLIATVPLSTLIIYYIQFHLYGQIDPGNLGRRQPQPAAYGYGSDTPVTTAPWPETTAPDVTVTDPTTTTVAPDVTVTDPTASSDEPLESDEPPIPPASDEPQR